MKHLVARYQRQVNERAFLGFQLASLSLTTLLYEMMQLGLAHVVRGRQVAGTTPWR
jgi:hypothetical protein